MSDMALGIPLGLAIGMGSGIAIGVASGSQTGRRQAGKDVAAWLASEGVQLIARDGQPMTAEALLAVIVGPAAPGKGKRGNRD